MKLTIGELLRNARENAGLKQVDVKQKSNISNHNLSNWEKGKSEPCIADAIILADLYGITLDELFGHKLNNIHTVLFCRQMRIFHSLGMCNYSICICLSHMLFL